MRGRAPPRRSLPYVAGGIGWVNSDVAFAWNLQSGLNLRFNNKPTGFVGYRFQRIEGTDFGDLDSHVGRVGLRTNWDTPGRLRTPSLMLDKGVVRYGDPLAPFPTRASTTIQWPAGEHGRAVHARAHVCEMTMPDCKTCAHHNGPMGMCRATLNGLKFERSCLDKSIALCGPNGTL